MGKKDKEKKKGKGAAKTAEKTEKKQKTKIKKDLVAKGKESATGILLLSVLWIRNTLFRIRLRVFKVPDHTHVF